MDALTRELGVVGMIRFMRQFEMGKGDYTRERHQWLDKYSVEDIGRMIKEEREIHRQKK